MTAVALGVDQKSGYPRAVVEPLLWLAVTTGFVWLLVAFEAREKTSTGAAPIESGMSVLAAALALVLILNGLAALLLAAQGGSVARGLAAVTGLGLAVSGWAFALIPEITPEARYWLLVGSVACGLGLAVIAQLHWRVVKRAPGDDERGTAELVLVTVLVVVAIGVGYRAHDALASGLVGVGSTNKAAWSHFLPAAQAMATLLATIGQVWNRRWLAAAVTMAIGTALTVGLYLVS